MVALFLHTMEMEMEALCTESGVFLLSSTNKIFPWTGLLKNNHFWKMGWPRSSESSAAAQKKSKSKTPRKPKDAAAQLKQKSPAEFFADNKNIAGFDNPGNCLYTTVRELVENALDSAESISELPIVEITIYACESNIILHAKIALQLKNKSVRDVALRCRWMTRKEINKKRKDDFNARKNKDRKDFEDANLRF